MFVSSVKGIKELRLAHTSKHELVVVTFQYCYVVLSSLTNLSKLKNFKLTFENVFLEPNMYERLQQQNR